MYSTQRDLVVSAPAIAICLQLSISSSYTKGFNITQGYFYQERLWDSMGTGYKLKGKAINLFAKFKPNDEVHTLLLLLIEIVNLHELSSLVTMARISTHAFLHRARARDRHLRPRYQLLVHLPKVLELQVRHVQLKRVRISSQTLWMHSI
ncbi:hypothetical protein DFH05DRAFT_565274 [Lentinula detonsa]|uniref:Uncharacterized protein n=1 Tax=Lentinula detonsa TaxID=2804962 RepID=A0A9W8U1C4_9AGAR|nr:hypothetical protein DFH05DRAFT_565274 [Lentinula detonsa]